jgi:hypothetical protein
LFISRKPLIQDKPATGFMGGNAAPRPVLADAGAANAAAAPAGKRQSHKIHQ